MNSINLNALSVHFNNPWLLFVFIPAVALMLIPYFRLKKQHRRTRNRVISLVLHSVILACMTLLLAGLSFTYTQVNVKKDVVLLVDVSESVRGSEDDMTDFIKSVLADAGSGYDVNVVTFANDSVKSSKMSADSVTADKIFANAEENGRYATDISSALLFSRDLLSSPHDGRIILLSDGLQTDGNAIVTAQALAEEGIRIDTVFFPSKGYNPEVLISSVEAVMQDEVTAEILVTVDSTAAQSADLYLYDNGESLTDGKPVNVMLVEGQYTIPLSERLPVADLHEICVSIKVNADTITENNTCYTYLNLEVSKKTLLVEGGGRDTQALSGILDESFDVTKISVSELPDSIEELCKYNLVILMNVANADLPAGFDKILTDYVKVYGGGLYTVGGDRAYVQDDMEGTAYEDLLPIRANTDAKTMGLLYVIDNSSSMDEKVGDKTRMELAIDAAVASVESLATLAPDDWVGVISFDKDADVVSEMRPMDSKDTVIERIRTIEVGYKTGYYNALVAARGMLTAFSQTELKHIIFLTDGNRTDMEEGVTDQDIYDYIDQMAGNGITLSTITLSSDVTTDTAEKMAEHGNGRFYAVVQESRLRSIMVEETSAAAGQYYNEVRFTPSIVSHTAAVAGITALDMPELGGFYGSRIKDGATMVLGYMGSPIYAEWSCGEGRVGSFMSDLYGDWSSGFLTDKYGVRFITNTVSSLLSKTLNEQGGGELSVNFTNDNFTTRAQITARLDAGETLTAKILAPNDKDGREVALEKLTDSIFACTFKTDTAGIYTLLITRTGADGTQTYSAYTAFSYSEEYLLPADENESFRFMENLSENGKGSMLFSAENLFGKNNESVTSNYNPTLVLLIICSVLFLLDIVVRKFKIKLPREIREERKGNFSSDN